MGFKFKELDGELGEVIQGMMTRNKMVLVEQDETSQIWRESSCLHVLDLDIDIYAATECVYCNDTEDYELSSSLHIFYKHGTTEAVYSEYANSLAACIYNYASRIGQTDLQDMNAIGELACIYYLNWDEARHDTVQEDF